MIATRTDPELKEMFDRIHQASSLARGGGGDHKVGPVTPAALWVHSAYMQTESARKSTRSKNHARS